MTNAAGQMRASLICVALAITAVAAQNAASFKDKQAEELFRNSRIAVAGTPGAVAKLKTLRFTGKSRLPATSGAMVGATVEIKILLPDYYMRTDIMTSGERIEGYAGSKVLNAMRTAGRSSAPPESEKRSLLRFEQSELARLLLGTTTWVSTEQSMGFYSRGTPVEMPGQAGPLGLDVVDDEGHPLLRFFVEAESRFPARIVFSGSERAVWTMTFADRRPVSGWQLPHHITTTSQRGTVDELIFDEMLVNPPLTKADFQR
jgi:hypothetical protein